MICRKFLRHWIGVLLAGTLLGCTTPTETLIVPVTPSQTTVPVQVFPLTSNPTPTVVEISTFEECYVGGWIQGPYPRQCITVDGEVFIETLADGVLFSKTYSTTTRHETARFITSTRDGGYLITGHANVGCWILKLDSLGEKQWEVSFEQELSREFHHQSTGFSCLLARQTPNNGYVIMGQEFDLYSGLFQRSFFTITLDQQGSWVSGQLIAEKAGKVPYLDPDGNLIRLTSIGTSARVTETNDEGYITVSQSPERSADSSTHITKTDDKGNYVWDRNLCLDKSIQQAEERRFVCSQDSHVWDVIQLQDGSFVMTGVFYAVGWLVKTDTEGNLEWIREHEGSGHALLPLSDGGYLIAGGQRNNGVIIKTDSLGNMQLSRTFPGGMFMAMAQGANGEIIIMGRGSSSAGWEELWLLGITSTLLR